MSKLTVYCFCNNGLQPAPQLHTFQHEPWPGQIVKAVNLRSLSRIGSSFKRLLLPLGFVQLRSFLMISLKAIGLLSTCCCSLLVRLFNDLIRRRFNSLATRISMKKRIQRELKHRFNWMVNAIFSRRLKNNKIRKKNYCCESKGKAGKNLPKLLISSQKILSTNSHY